MKRFEQFRIKRQKVYEGLFSARVLCIAGLIAMPAMLFNPFPAFKALQFLFFWFLCWLAGRKNSPLITISVILVIVAFNMLVPFGEIIYSIGRFRLTWGALFLGIERAITLQGLIMLSRLAIRRDLKIPGGFGELIGESFQYFAIIMDSKKRITRKNLMGDIDQLLIELSEGKLPGAEDEATSENPKLCVTRPIQNAHLPHVNSAFDSVASIDFGVF